MVKNLGFFTGWYCQVISHGKKNPIRRELPDGIFLPWQIT